MTRFVIKQIKLERLCVRKSIVAFLSIILCLQAGFAAPVRRGNARTQTATTSTAAKQTTSARSAVTARSARSATPTTSATSGARTMSARSGTRGVTNVKAAPVTSARAATTQKVINSGTKVVGAYKNTVVDEVCQEKYYGCMDAFCMIDNENGGRCACSDKKAEYDKILKDIEELDLRSYELATSGVEQVEMGLNADDIMSAADSVVAKLDAKKKRSLVDLSLWGDKEDEKSMGMSELDGKEGQDLYNAVHGICTNRMPECANDVAILKMMYVRQIDSDCAAYDNSLKQKKLKAQQNLDTAQRALRESVMEQYQSANKYDLGQCTLKFKECMQTTAGCGDDFSGCATVVAMDNTNTVKSAKRNAKYLIEGAKSGIEISLSTYDTLVAKRVMCENVTKQCVKVADQVFDAFLRDVAPQLRSAELIAEDDVRQNCVVNISDCFQQACKDNIDPNDPDGSYDMCLTRPETMMNVCKIPLNACGINTVQESTAKESQIWNFVLARLASMRVDECTTQIKQCLQSSDRCGSDYSGCLGLDMQSIIEMCPIDKLVACDASSYGGNKSEKENYVYNVAQGLLLNVDNSFFEQCQNAVQTKMLEICGSTVNCFTDKNEYIGKNSLHVSQQENGDWLIDGTIMWGNVKMDHPDDMMTKSAGYNVYYDVAGLPETIENRINNTVVADIQNELNRKMSILMTDPTISMCINGRDMSQIKRGAKRDTARYPNLLVPYANVMFDSLVDIAKLNYNLEYANAYARANSLSEQYKNTMFCNAMVSNADTGAPVLAQQESGVKDWTDYSVLIAGTFNQNLMDAIAAGAEIENVISVEETVGTEGLGEGKKDSKKSKFEKVNAAVTRKNEIARERIVAIYEPGPQVCRITKTLYPCTGFSAAYNEESESYSVGVQVGVTVGDTGANVGTTTSESESSKTYQGKTCATYAEPLIVEQLINFADDNVIAGQITRSNLTSMTIDNSSYTTATDNSWSLGLSASVSVDKSQNTTNNVTADSVNVQNADSVTANEGTIIADNANVKKADKVSSVSTTVNNADAVSADNATVNTQNANVKNAQSVNAKGNTTVDNAQNVNARGKTSVNHADNVNNNMINK